QTYSFAGMPEIRMLRVVVGGAPKPGMRFPRRLPVPIREYPLIRDQDITARRTIRWTEENPAPQMILGTAFQINNKSYDPDEALVTTYVGAVEEWNLVNESGEGHPVHVHVNSMQVDTAYLSPTQPRHCDVLWVPAQSSVKIRMRFKQWSGKAVMHCHILYHEDQGMMTNMVIKKKPRA
ncbi:MAG: multicopper oxidase domain-containing protein, partial [Candidatus Limnocylindrus sp.]